MIIVNICVGVTIVAIIVFNVVRYYIDNFDFSINFDDKDLLF